jgi:hypothetical protein
MEDGIMTRVNTNQFQNDMKGTPRRLEDTEDLDIARAASAKARTEGVVPWEQAKKELGLTTGPVCRLHRK